MTIPKLHYVSQGSTPIAHLENIQKACASGAELVQLRLKNVSEKNPIPRSINQCNPSCRSYLCGGDPIHLNHHHVIQEEHQ